MIPVEFQRLHFVLENYCLQQFLNVKKKADGIIFLQSVDAVPTAGSPARCKTVMGDSLCLLPFGNKTMRQQTPAAFGDRKTVNLRDNCEHLFLNEAQWLGYGIARTLRE